ncbi:TPA: hypothetical protein ACGO1N_000642 [Streptococcus suis]
MDYKIFKKGLFKYLNFEEDVAEEKLFFIPDGYPYRNETTFVFEDSEMELLFNSISSYHQKDNYLIVSEKFFELFLTSSDVRRPARYAYQDVEVDDSVSDIKYSISKISKEATFYLLYKRIEGLVYQQYGSLWYFDNMDFRSRRIRLNKIDGVVDYEHKSILEFFSEQIIPYYFSLKISSEVPRDIDAFKQYKDSFIFTYIYNKGRSITEAENLNKLGDGRRRVATSREELEAPKRKYDPYIIEYYRQASESSDPFIQFISYYHILEYFYDEVYNKRLIDDLIEQITHPSFSYKNKEKIKQLAMFSHKRLKGFGDDGQGNELESLKFVLREFIDVVELKNRILELRQDTNYYESNNVSFSKGPTINFSDEEGVYTSLAKRIYYTRNSLIHSKSNRKSQTYRVSSHKDILKNEIPLLEAVSELVILNSSEIL